MRQLLQLMGLFVGLAVSIAAGATAQMTDTILLDGQAYALNTNPLDRYLEQQQWQPPKEAVITSANWRGYTATWAIVDKQLLLKDVTINVRRGDDFVETSLLGELFPAGQPVVATWYTGALVIPDGEMTQYVHMGYGSVYAHYQIVSVSKGQVTGQLSLAEDEFRQYKARKFQAFKKTSQYAEARAELMQSGTEMPPEALDGFMESFFAETYLAQ